MSRRILVVPDKFKGTLSARAAAHLIAEAWREVHPADQLELLPMSDGGDGFGEVLSALLCAEARTVLTVDAARRPRSAKWWWEPKSRTAIIETAQVIGLALLPPGKYHPFELDTFGVGSVLRAAVEAGALRCLVGIGGSATNDGGFGLARSLGWRFNSQGGQSIEEWTQMDSLETIIPPRSLLPEVLVAVDVQNPLLGTPGASRIYGPQKGLRLEDMPQAERCLERLSEICQRDLRLAPPSVPGDGAAGGLGFGLRCFTNACLESGFKLFAQCARLEERIRAAQLVITGEGAIDASTSMGKGVGQVADVCQAQGIPCLGLAGTVASDLSGCSASGKFTRIFGIAPDFASLEDAQRNAAFWLRRLAADVARSWP